MIDHEPLTPDELRREDIESGRAHGTLYYFGCVGETGHYMFDPFLQHCHRFTYENPWGFSIDGTLAPKRDTAEGVACIHQKDGWTALAFWDRSVDTRYGSHSTFLAQGTFDFQTMLGIARQTFPSIFARFGFKVVEACTEKSS